MQSTSKLSYQIALTLIPGVGDVLAKNLISYCGNAEAVFKSSKSSLFKIPGIGKSVVEAITQSSVLLKRAEEEEQFIEKYKIKPLFYTDASYPKRLKNCVDAPVMLYYKGQSDLNAPRVINIIGTRKATEYGKQVCAQLIEQLKPYSPLVVSGLAYGIDVQAHKECLKNDVSTVAVLGHGLDRIYPAAHRATAEKMLANGGLLSDFTSGTNPDRENFPKRNRIIAGLADATILVEAAESGGAIITAVIANSYNRDVFAIPGRINDAYSGGCNHLIKTNRAALVSSGADIAYSLGWDISDDKGPVQRQLLVDLSADEQVLVDLLRENGNLPIDELMLRSNMNLSILAAVLLNLELKGVLMVLPGKMYQLL